MDRKTRVLLVAGLLITLAVFFINIYAGGILLIILVAIVMTLIIMQDTTSLPNVVAELREDAKGIIVRNAGNAQAMKIHVALVPENIEYDIDSLQPDASHVYSLAKMIGSVKIVVNYENEKGEAFTRSYEVSSTGETYDPLKPMIPLFRWR